ncbi:MULTISPECIES: SPOR domain-containing protein [unclassified Nitratiruptor]|uniref:SPOR domain-containing protein n=1 Tax=unclassified Nitratiruptor TaxID=2624044 RepID=UPI0019150AFA|nr:MULTISPECIES: SPOR domain-containing protein [unclassified Nitratiruptor]BCD60099.1 hypothetical protein NitYY0810_C0864 [Nitratiruptor sp. YY08-10]BCD64412.1 DedD protein [Nitratiruptor sp. YY08-14]
MGQEEFPLNEEKETDNLDNIILQQDEKREKLKKYLLLIGSLLLVFIIILTIVKMFNNTTPNYQEVLTENEKFLDEEPMNDEFQEVPIQKSEESQPKAATEEKPIQKVLKEVKETENKERPAAKPQPKSTAQKTQKNSVKKEIVQPKAVQQSVKTTKSKTSAKSIKENIYIQVGAFLRSSPDQSLLRKIKKLGFHYVIKSFTINGKKIKRVYVGPFVSKSDAREALVKVRKSINKQAFITKVR